MLLGSRKNKCRRVKDLLSEYIDGRLDSRDTEFVDRHVEVCRGCSEELESLRSTVQLLHRVPSVAVPRSFAIRDADVARGPAPREPRGLRPVLVPVAVSADAGRTSILAPERLRWLRPATAVVAAALVLVLALDFLQVVPQEGQVNLREQFELPRTVVATPGDAEQMEGPLKLEEGGEVEDAAPAPVPAPEGPAESVSGDAIFGAPVPEIEVLESVSDDTGGGWPMRQIEIAVGSVLVALVALTMVLWRRRRWTGT